MKETTHRAKDYARLFRSIPDEQWAVGVLETADGRKCAMGHVGANPIKRCQAAIRLNDICLFAFGREATAINDGLFKDFTQPTPKFRMVAAMEKAKELGF